MKKQKDIIESRAHIAFLPSDRAAKAKAIAIMNAKGGVGKTSTAINFAIDMVKSGKNVLLWDNDAQKNLTQRLGITEGSFKERRLDQYYLLADKEGQWKKAVNLPIIIEYPGLSKRRGAMDVEALGTLAVMAGSTHAEAMAAMAKAKISEAYGILGYSNIRQYVQKTLNYYKQYYDYIIMDTAPSLEGKFLNALTVGVVDEIICPIDGLEAALGIRALMTFIENNISSETTKRPNMLFAMVKYHSVNGTDPTNERLIQNGVYNTLKGVLNSYICESGVKERKSLRRQSIMFRKSEFQELSLEIAKKIETTRGDIFQYFNVKKEEELVKGLRILENIQLTKHPVFKQPIYSEIPK